MPWKKLLVWATGQIDEALRSVTAPIPGRNNILLVDGHVELYALKDFYQWEWRRDWQIPTTIPAPR